MLPYLKKAGLKFPSYTGIDISPVMIEQLLKKKVNGVCGDFAVWNPTATPSKETYDVILMNAVLQYVDNPLDVVRKATSLCKTVVIAHYQGRNFIKDEVRSMGEDKIEYMPSREEITCAIGSDWTIDEKISRKDHELDEFYLIKLSKR